MAGKLASLIIKISANGAEAEKELKKLERKMSDFSKNLKKLGTDMSKYITAPITAMAGVSVAAANTQLQAEAKLLKALQGRSDVQQRLIKQAGELQSRSTLGDEAIIEQQAYLAALGLSEQQIGSTIEAAAQLSAALDIDLGSAVKNLAKTFGGMAGELGESIPALKNFTAEQLMAGETVKYVNDNYKGFAETAASTGTGPLTQLKNIIGDIAESFGVILLPAIQKFAAKLKELATAFQDLSPQIQKTIVVVAAVVAAIGPAIVALSKLVNVVKIFALALPAIKATLASMVTPIGLLTTGVIALAGSWLLAKRRMREYEKDAMALAQEQGEQEGKARFERDLANSISFIKDRGYSDEELAANIKAAMHKVAQLEARGEDAYKSKVVLTALMKVRNEREAELELIKKTNDETTKQVGIIAELNAKITELEKSKTAAESETEIARINGLLEKARAELERISNLKDVEIKIAVKVDTPASLNTSPLTESPTLDIDGISKSISKSIAKTTAIADFREFWDNLSAEVERGAETIAQITSTLKSSISSLATTLGEGLGNVLSENKPEDFDFKLSMLNALGNALKTLGSALVSYGIAMIEFKKALNMAWLTPGLAITAGLAAVALGQGLINKANAPVKLATGGLAYGPTLAVVGDNRGAASDPEVIAPLSKLRNYIGGQQLQLVGGVAFELRGDVVRAVLDRENFRLNRKG